MTQVLSLSGSYGGANRSPDLELVECISGIVSMALTSAFRFPSTESGVDVLAVALPCAGADVVTSA